MAGLPMGKTMSRLRGSKIFLPQLLDTLFSIVCNHLTLPWGAVTHSQGALEDSIISGKPEEEVGQVASDSG